MNLRFAFLIWLAVSLLPLFTSAQEIESLTTAYPAALCPACEDWNVPHEPFRIHHNTFFVGTRGLSSILITSEEGHILLDGGLPNSAPIILENIRSLGFDPTEIKLILNSHVHYDHAGGIAALQLVSGARVAASPRSVPVLERGVGGPDDPQFGMLLEFPPVDNVERFTPGDTLRIGNVWIASHKTAGHTPGGTSWSWTSCEADNCLDLVYADSQTPVSEDSFRFTDSETYPTALEDFERGFRTLEKLPCDILITTHPGASPLWERLSEGDDGLIDAQACTRYADAARQRLAQRVEIERADSEKEE